MKRTIVTLVLVACIVSAHAGDRNCCTEANVYAGAIRGAYMAIQDGDVDRAVAILEKAAGYGNIPLE